MFRFPVLVLLVQTVTAQLFGMSWGRWRDIGDYRGTVGVGVRQQVLNLFVHVPTHVTDVAFDFF